MDVAGERGGAVVLAADAVVRSGLCVLLAETGLPVVSTTGIDTAARAVAARGAEVLVVDGAPDGPGAALLGDAGWVRRFAGCAAVVVVDGPGSSDAMARAVSVGARAVVTRAGGRRDLWAAVGAVRSGRGWVDPVVAAAALGVAVPGRLTPREDDVLGCLRAGLSNAETARALLVSVGTVKYHVSNILAKLRVRSREQLVARTG